MVAAPLAIVPAAAVHTPAEEPSPAPFPAPPPPAPPSAAPPAAPRQPTVPGSPVDCAVQRCVALTFDDGPGPYTAVQAELRAAGVRATSSVTGLSTAAHPDLVRRAVADGHAVGSHTWSHRHLTALSPAGIAAEIDPTTSALVDVGVTTDLLRPPYGDTGPTVAAAAGGGMVQVLSDGDTGDWRNRDVGITQCALDGAQPGAIVLVHDIHPTTVQAVPGVIGALRAQGHTLVTLPELLGPTCPGEAYSHR